jgi:hypothetical protein
MSFRPYIHLNTWFALFALIIGSLSFTSCDFNCISVEGIGPLVNKTFKSEPFNSIDCNISATVRIRQSELVSVSALGQQNILDLLEIKVEGQKLVIDYKQECVMTSFDSLIITISAPEIASLHLNGSGEMSTIGSITQQNLDVIINGSGSIRASIISPGKLNASIAGSGNMFLDGTTVDANFDIAGSGEIHAYDLQAKTISIEISGSGDASVFASEKIDAKVSGSGDVHYKGNPQVTTSITGSGDIKKVE